MSRRDEQDGPSPLVQVQAAVASLRAAAELTGGGMDLDRPGWGYVPDAHRLLVEVAELAAVLPEVLEHTRDAVRHELELNLIDIDPGTQYDGRPDAAVQAAGEGIAAAVVAAWQLNNAAAAAAGALTYAAYGGREDDL